MRRAAGRLDHEHDQPDQAAEPDRAGGEVRPVERSDDAARRRLRRRGRRRPARAAPRPRRQRAGECEQLGDRALLALGPVDPERDERRRARTARTRARGRGSPGRTTRRASAAPARRRPRPSAARTAPSRAARRPGSRRARRAATTNAIETRAASSRARAARAAARSPIRSTNRPIAAITDEEDEPAQRRAAAAWRPSPRSTGSTNCGAGPGFGPTANVNAPRTGWPSAEITRH